MTTNRVHPVVKVFLTARTSAAKVRKDENTSRLLTRKRRAMLVGGQWKRNSCVSSISCGFEPIH